MKQIPTSLLTLTAGVLVTLISLWVGQHHGLFPEQASMQAPLVDQFFNVMITIGTALFLVVEGAIVIFLIRYRRPRGDNTDGLPVEGNLPLEAFWTAIPAIIVIGLGIYSVNIFQDMGGFNPGGHNHSMASHGADSTLVAQMPTGSEMAVAGDVVPLLDGTQVADAQSILASPETAEYGLGADPNNIGQLPDLAINVTGMQYAWLFNYPDSGITAGELHVPLGADVQLNLAAQDVIHSFWVPQFRVKQDAIPGMKTELRFVATKLGTFPVVCTELCGSYHGGMRSQVIVHSPEDYSSWLEQNRVAQGQMGSEAIAINPASRSDSDFLAPYANEMGATGRALAQLHNSHEAMSH